MTGGTAINWRRDWRPWAILACCCAEALTNAVGGYDLVGGADGGFKAWFIAGGGIIVAALGAWMATEAVKTWRMPGWRGLAAVMLAVGVGCFSLSQFTGWRVFSSGFVDGALKREDKGNTFARLQEEKAKLGVLRPKAAVEAELSLELRNTSRQYPNGDGPKALKLKSELASVNRLAEIEQELAKARKGGSVVKAGSENLIMSKAGLRNEQSIMLIVVLIMGLIGFFAYFGFAILELVSGGAAQAGDASPEMFDPLLLPAPPMRQSLPPPSAAGGGGQPQSPRQGGPGAGNVVNVYAAPEGRLQRLPPRAAARMAG